VTASTLQALVLAAGKGTRTRSARAKVLLPVLGLPLVEHVLRALSAVGADPATLVVGHQGAEGGEERVGLFDCEVTSAHQDTG